VSSLSVLRHCYLPTAAGAAVVAVGSRLLFIPLAHSLAATLALMFFSAVLSIVLSGLFGAVTRADLKSLSGLAHQVFDRLRRA